MAITGLAAVLYEKEGYTRRVRSELAPIGGHVHLNAPRFRDTLQLAFISRRAAEVLEHSHHLEHGKRVHEGDLFPEAFMRTMAKSDIGVFWAVKTNLVPGRV